MQLTRMDHGVITNTNNDKVKVFHDNKLKFDSNFSLPSDLYIKPQTVVTVKVKDDKKLHETHVSRLTCLWYSGTSDIMIKNICVY